MKFSLILLTVSTVFAIRINFQSETGTGLIFSREADVKISYNEWKVLYYMDMNSFFDEGNVLGN